MSRFDLENFYLGIGGVLTFKNAGLDKTIEQINLRHLILETDSPYLAPAPFRGKRNEPSYIKYIAEFLPVSNYEYKTGQEFGVSLFKPGELVSVSGNSKGKGFSGVMKRHGFGGGPKTHGQREHPRSPGSIGQASDPSRVFKGMKMAGQYGNKKVSTRNLEIVSVNKDNNQLLIKGAIPGPYNGIIFISK